MAALYILKSESSGKFYIGSASDPSRRLNEHVRHHRPCTRERGPRALVCPENVAVLAEARGRERQIKGWKSHRMIQVLIAGAPVQG